MLHTLISLALLSLSGCVYLFVPELDEWDGTEIAITHTTSESRGQTEAKSVSFTSFAGFRFKKSSPDRDLSAGLELQYASGESAWAGDKEPELLLYSNWLGYEHQAISALGPLYLGAGITGDAVAGDKGGYYDERFSGGGFGLYAEVGVHVSGLAVVIRFREGLYSSIDDEAIDDVLLRGSSIMLGVGLSRVDQ